ncbi:hypothetical protein SAMN04488102_10215 [Alkalibacterium subtropicum]|uniref:Lipoprotein n=1 Tax=Alkalibacterium subtropicum TaxID=753702 RepID=A0A1I1FG51_9LACT|nr:hypothetical protein [Alkalibacterium subtropicum]SFB96040.1 hypothetical protein SAMN04488102_10215 [Alkalibacterium subtropicum]
MDYKKLVSLLAVSSFALAGCETEEAEDVEQSVEDVADETEDAVEEGADEAEQSAHDIIDDIGSDLDYTSPIELTVSGGSWSQDGYVFTPENGEATVSGLAEGNEEVEEIFAFVIQDGEVVEKPEVTEGEFTFTASAADTEQQYQIGVADEDLWEVGDEADAEELVRFENVIIPANEAE